MDKELVVTLTRTFDGKPLAHIANFPGEGADLRPEQMRALAAALCLAADDCEARVMGPKSMQQMKRSYSLTQQCVTPAFGLAYLEKSAAERKQGREARLARRLQDVSGK